MKMLCFWRHNKKFEFAIACRIYKVVQTFRNGFRLLDHFLLEKNKICLLNNINTFPLIRQSLLA